MRNSLHTRFDNKTGEDFLILKWPDGRQAIKRFSTISNFQRRLTALQNQLELQKWQQAGPPVTLADGWPDDTDADGRDVFH